MKMLKFFGGAIHVVGLPMNSKWLVGCRLVVVGACSEGTFKMADQAASSNSAKKRKPGRPTSIIRQYFKEVTEADGDDKFHQCRCCHALFTGTTISRMKSHIGGGSFSQVKQCKPTSADGLQLLKEAKNCLDAERVRDARRLKKRKAEDNAMVEVTTSQRPKPATLNDMWSGVTGEEVHQAWARLCYANALPFALMDSPWFHSAVATTIAHARKKSGAAYKPPTRQAVATKYLDLEKLRTSKALRLRLFGTNPTISDGKICAEYGLSITSDGWSDRSHKL
jgi:hypothetical protein